VKQRLVSSATPSRPGEGENRLGWGWPAGRGLLSDLVRGPRACSGLLKARAIHRSGSGVGTEQGQVEPWPRDQPDVGSMLLAPAQLE
jgi:hypothetical protein